MKYINATTARTTFLNLVENLDERIAITKNGQPVAVLLDYDDFRALRASQALARDSEKLAHVKATAERVEQGDVDGFQEANEAKKTRARREPASAQ